MVMFRATGDDLFAFVKHVSDNHERTGHTILDDYSERVVVILKDKAPHWRGDFAKQINLGTAGRDTRTIDFNAPYSSFVMGGGVKRDVDFDTNASFREWAFDPRKFGAQSRADLDKLRRHVRARGTKKAKGREGDVDWVEVSVSESDQDFSTISKDKLGELVSGAERISRGKLNRVFGSDDG